MTTNSNSCSFLQDRLTSHGGISSLGGGNSSPYSGAHHHGHRGNGNGGGGMPHHAGASLPTASDFQPPYFPPPFPTHHHAPASPQHGLGQPQHLDYLVGDPYTQTLNTLHQHHYNHLSAAVSAGQRSGDLRRDAESIHVVSRDVQWPSFKHSMGSDKIDKFLAIPWPRGNFVMVEKERESSIVLLSSCKSSPFGYIFNYLYSKVVK